MFKNILNQVGGIGLYGIVSTLIFFGFFVALLVVVLGMRRAHAERMSRLPLEPDTFNSQQGAHHD
jgi:hypothetical protein